MVAIIFPFHSLLFRAMYIHCRERMVYFLFKSKPFSLFVHAVALLPFRSSYPVSLSALWNIHTLLNNTEQIPVKQCCCFCSTVKGTHNGAQHKNKHIAEFFTCLTFNDFWMIFSVDSNRVHRESCVTTTIPILSVNCFVWIFLAPPGLDTLKPLHSWNETLAIWFSVWFDLVCVFPS